VSLSRPVSRFQREVKQDRERRMSRRPHQALLLAILALAEAPVVAVAQTPGEVDGAAIAAGRCGRCHATGLSDPSPQRITPPFRTLHERWPIEMLVEARKTGIIDGHDEMPAFDFSPEEITALLRHIDSLTPAGAPRYITGDADKRGK
jgi:cytochrome c